MTDNPDPPRNFFAEHWDKIATLILGGVVGYFSGIQGTADKISSLSERLAKIE